jgi:glutaredoxin
MSYTIYSKPGCVFCEHAKNYLNSRGLAYTEKIVDVGQHKYATKTYVSVVELRQLIPGVKSVPQIFFEDTHIGGYEDLKKYVESK